MTYTYMYIYIHIYKRHRCGSLTKGFLVLSNYYSWNLIYANRNVQKQYKNVYRKIQMIHQLLVMLKMLICKIKTIQLCAYFRKL